MVKFVRNSNYFGEWKKGVFAGEDYRVKLKANSHIQCFLLNTGWVGEGPRFRDITLGDTMAILDAVFRKALGHWSPSQGTGLVVPRAIPAVDSVLCRPIKLWTHAEFEKRQAALDRQRAEFLDRYPGLHPAVKAVFQK